MPTSDTRWLPNFSVARWRGWRLATRQIPPNDRIYCLKSFDGRCSLRTWAYRVAHNVAADHVARAKRWNDTFSLDDLGKFDPVDPKPSPETGLAERQALSQIHAILHRLGPIDRQVMILYLEDESAATIADVSGLSAVAVATRIHRVKRLIADRFKVGAAR
jgi:RNA polymerase sigma factor (sigma-70 family)